MPEQCGDKQHDATPHRRQKAREEGHTPRSQDLASAVVLVGGLAAMMFLGRGLFDFLGRFARHQWSETPELHADPGSFFAETATLGGELAMAMLPLLGVILLTAVVVNVAQVGFLFLPEKLAMDLSRLNPLAGLRRMFSLPSAARLGFGLFKIAVVGIVAGLSL